MITFSQFLVDEEEAIADNKIYLSNMAKSFKDKAWFIITWPRKGNHLQ